MIKVLNLYVGIGGNRDLWEGDIEVTHVEYNPKIAKILQHFYPHDKVIVGDAHQYLLEHYKEFDFIWSSPPCPTHSRIRKFTSGGKFKEVYPDMALYQEIIFLMHHFKGKWVVENVIGYYEPLIKPQEVNRHYFWSNFIISKINLPSQGISFIKKNDTIFGKNIGDFDLDSDYNHVKVLRNMVNPKLGKHIFDCAYRSKQLLLSEVSGNSSHD